MERRPSGCSRSSVSISWQQPCWPPSLSLRFLNRLLNDTREVDVVLETLVFHDPRFGRPVQGRAIDERPGKNAGILDDGLVGKAFTDQVIALRHLVLVAGYPHRARSPDLAIEVGHFDNERVAVPSPDGIAVISGD